MDKNEFKNLIKDAYYAPEPEKKMEFISRFRPRKVSTFRMLLQQIPYIRPYVWILAAAIVGIAIAGSVTGGEGTDKLVALIMPFTAAVGILENERSRRYNMSELEMATRFSLRSVVIARMTIMGFLSVILTAIVSPVIAESFGMQAVITAETILMPYLMTMIISLHIERSPLGRKNGASSIVAAGAVMLLFLLIWESESGNVLYSSFISGGCGLAAVIILGALTLTEQWLTVRNMEAFA